MRSVDSIRTSTEQNDNVKTAISNENAEVYA